jgi:CubicO group peptidase (beta-lactamase class C family)
MNRRQALAAAGGLLLPAGVFAQKPAQGTILAVNAVFDAVMEKHGVVGATVAVAKDGKLVTARGFGLSDADDKKALVTADTLFCIGSVTKAVTGLGILKLVDAGKVKLDDKLLDVVGKVKPAGGKIADERYQAITVRQLLSHTAGVPDRIEVKGVAEKAQEPEKVLAAALALPLDFAPGAEHRYSNSGFVVARLVLERAGKTEYEPFIRDEVLKPLGITRAVMETTKRQDGETERYARSPKGVKPAARNPSNWLFTASDLVRVAAAVAGVRGKAFLSQDTSREMLAPPPPPVKGRKDGYHVGLGWDRAIDGKGGRGFGKNGHKAGVHAWLEHRPDGHTWAFMINTTISPDPQPKPEAEILKPVTEILDAGPRWPERDLFGKK